MKIKAFATDLDGTLLYKNEISQSNLKAIESLKESGVIPIFVTGRIYTCLLYTSFPRMQALLEDNNVIGVEFIFGELLQGAKTCLLYTSRCV